MKKTVLLVSFLFVFNTFFSIADEKNNNFSIPQHELNLIENGQLIKDFPAKKDNYYNSSGSDSVSVSTWYNILEKAPNLGVLFTPIFPDSQVYNLFIEQGSPNKHHVFRHSAGQMLDPTDFYYNQSPTHTIPKEGKYTVDSVRLYFVYHRPLDEIIYDTDSIWWDTNVYAFSVNQMFPDNIEIMYDTSWSYSYNSVDSTTDSTANASFEIHFYDHSMDVRNPDINILTVWPAYTRYEFDENGDTVLVENVPADTIIQNYTTNYQELEIIELTRKVKDSLIVQFTKDESVFGNPRISRGQFDSGRPTAYTAANHNRILAGRANTEVVISLDESHVSTTQDPTIITLPVKMTSIENRELFAVTFTYFPDFPFELFDTLYNELENVDPPTKLLNNFMIPLTFMNNENLLSMNHGLFIHIQNQYYTDRGWRGNYIPGNAFLNYDLGVYVDFHITSTFKPSSISEITDNGFGLGNAYPNPAAQDETINIEFAVGNNELVTIEIYNLVGQKIKTITKDVYNAGNHTVSFSSNNLKPGIYLYNMQAGSYFKTQKLNIK